MEPTFTKEEIAKVYQDYRNGFTVTASEHFTRQWILSNEGNEEDLELLTEYIASQE